MGEQGTGVYVMRVACMLSGMHPQTLRKYERAGLLVPSPSKMLRMYSDDDIARLRGWAHYAFDGGAGEFQNRRTLCGVMALIPSLLHSHLKVFSRILT